MAAHLVVDSRALSKNYASIKALDAVSFQVRPGEIFGFIGADGAGKTTAFRIIGGVLEPNAG
jgi:ABC-2 type transport system ATP-binding protein